MLKINDRESSSRRIATEASGSSAAEIKLSRELLVDWCGNQGGSGSNEDPCWAGGDVGNRSSIIFIDRPAASDLINDCFVGLLVPPLALQSKCQTPWFFPPKSHSFKNLASRKSFQSHFEHSNWYQKSWWFSINSTTLNCPFLPVTWNEMFSIEVRWSWVRSYLILNFFLLWSHSMSEGFDLVAW